MGDFEKKIPASACRKKKIACSTNVIESLWEKRGKNILPTRLLEKKFLMTRKVFTTILHESLLSTRLNIHLRNLPDFPPRTKTLSDINYRPFELDGDSLKQETSSLSGIQVSWRTLILKKNKPLSL